VINLTKAQRHTVLYAKCHYEMRSPIDDIKRIISCVCALDVDQVDDHTVYEFVLNLAFLVAKPMNIADNARRLFANRDQTCTLSQMMMNLIQVICAADVRRRLDLGLPDYDILPPAIGGSCVIGRDLQWHRGVNSL